MTESRKGNLEVQCKSGRVAVLKKDGTQLEALNPGDAVRVEAGRITEKWQFDQNKNQSWLNGISSFKKVSLETVLQEIERQYDVQIQTSTIDLSTIVSCNFQHKDLDLALKTSLSPLNIKYNIKSERLVELISE